MARVMMLLIFLGGLTFAPIFAQEAEMEADSMAIMDSVSVDSVMAVVSAPAEEASMSEVIGLSLKLSATYPRQDQPVTLIITDNNGQPVSGAVVSVEYRPNSSVPKLEDAGTTDTLGRLTWTPIDAGIATVKATYGEISTSQNIAIKFSKFPLSGLFIFLFAGILLYGGIAFSYIKLVSQY